METGISPLVQFNEFRRDETIVALDKLCDECYETDHMLCSGMRPFVNEELTKKYGYLSVTTGPCEKLRVKMQKTALERQISMSGIPASFADAHIDDKPWVWHFNGFIYMESTDEVREAIWRYGLQIMKQGKTFKYILTQILLKKFSEWDSLIEQLGSRYDVLVLDRYDLGNAPDMALDLLAELVRYRYANDLSTTVTVGKNPRVRCTAELSLYELMESW